MSQTDSPRFVVDCPECDMEISSNDYEDVMQGVSKHEKHTHHQMVFQKADMEMELTLNKSWLVECETCENDWTFETEDEARSHIDEHGAWTDHEIECDPEEIEDPLETDSRSAQIDAVEKVLEILGAEYGEYGAPEAIAVTVLEHHGLPQSQSRDILQRMRKTGSVYEPKRGYLRLT